MNVRQCKRCGVFIQWVTTSARRSVPIDLKPTDDGCFVLLYAVGGEAHVELFSPLKHDAMTTRYQSHFISCPQAERWSSEDWFDPSEWRAYSGGAA